MKPLLGAEMLKKPKVHFHDPSGTFISLESTHKVVFSFLGNYFF